MLDLTHLDNENDTPLIDMTAKEDNNRTARASGVLNMSERAIRLLAENTAGKGDILGVARVAAIQASKQTGFLIPLCQPLTLDRTRVDFDIDVELARVKATVTVSSQGSTSVEMEALTGVNIALLTIYDMLKTVNKGMSMTQIHLEEKTGGKNGTFVFSDDFENLNF